MGCAILVYQAEKDLRIDPVLQMAIQQSCQQQAPDFRPNHTDGGIGGSKLQFKLGHVAAG